MKNNVSFNSELSKFGIGLFETIKVKNSKAIYLDMHLDRMYKSSNELNIAIKYDKKSLKKFIERYIEDNKLTDKAIRITVFDEGYNISHRDLIYNKELYEKGFKLITSPVKRGDSIIYRHKTTNYFENIYTKNYAKANGFDEGLFTDLNGLILEGSMSNIFFIKDKNIYTPGKNLPILSGTTRKRLKNLCLKYNIKFMECNINIEDIGKYDFCFISNSLMGIMKVIQINDIRFDKDNQLFEFIWRNLL
jgi:4-amino-4-deoxychorismate lyase